MTQAMDTESTASPGRRRRPALLPLDAARGFLIGSAELVPGVSGGTVALVTGVYEELIESASHVISAIRRLVTGPDRWTCARAELSRTDWWLVVPVLVGMATAVLTIAGLMEGFVADHPERSRGLFFGLVLVSLVVPLRMLPGGLRGAGVRRRPAVVEVAAVLLSALLAFLLVGLASGSASADPALPVVFLAAAVAICALVVPGVSGSFFLLAVGLYSTTLTAVDSRDPVYMGVFAAGALVGLASFVQLLRWLLEQHRRTTLLVMTGLMLGSLRALWPWQSQPGGAAEGEAQGPGALVAPYDPVAGPVLMALLGAAVVAVLIVVEARMSPSGSDPASSGGGAAQSSTSSNATA